jgi:hypothetical protein
VVWKEWASGCWFQELIHGCHDAGGGGLVAEEDCRRERWGSSTVSTLPEVDASGVTQRSGRPAAEEDRTGEHRLASLMGEAARRRPRNQTTYELCQSSGQGRGAPRCSHRCREGRRWRCRCRNHHGRHRRGCRTAVVGVAGVVSDRRQPLKAVAHHTRGRHNLPGRRHSRGRVGQQTPRV